VTSQVVPWARPAAQARLVELEADHREDDAEAVHRSSLRHMRRFRRGRSQAISLYAGANLASPRVLRLHRPDLAGQPAMGWPGEKVQRGVEEIDHLEMLAMQQTARALGGHHAEVRFLSATMANLAVYTALTRPGDTIAVLSREAGAHQSQLGEDGTAAVRGLRVVHLPYDVDLLDVDPDALLGVVCREAPRLLVVGGSVALFPHDLAVLRAAADAVGAHVLYDASQCAGLIAAGLFQDPLAEGADVVTLSTYKTLGGPAGGAAVTRSPDLARRVSDAAYPTLTSNYDAARLGPLAVAAAEAVEQSPAWAAPSVELAASLARGLADRGVAVLGGDRGYTCSHQVVVDTGRSGGGAIACATLEAHRVLASACPLPTQAPGMAAAGVRLGVQELVRRGALPSSADLLSDLLHAVLSDAPAGRISELHGAMSSTLKTDLWGRHDC